MIKAPKVAAGCPFSNNEMEQCIFDKRAEKKV